MFYITERMGRIRDDMHVSSSSPGGGTGAKSAVSDFILSFDSRLLVRLFSVSPSACQQRNSTSY